MVANLTDIENKRNLSISRKLLFLIKKNGITEIELARALKLPYNTIHRVLHGITTDPRLSTIKLITDHLNVTLDQLTNDNFDLTDDDFPAANNIPLFSWSDLAGQNIFEKIRKRESKNWYPFVSSNMTEISHQAFAVESRPSMQPRFPIGTIFIVDPLPEPTDGDFIFIRVKESSDIAIKELMIDPPYWKLLSVTESHDTLDFSKELYEVVGVVMLTMLYTKRK